MKKLTLNNAISLFSNHLYARKLAEGTINAYIADTKMFAGFIKTNSYKVYVADLNKVDIMDYQSFLLNKNYKRTTVDRKYDSLQVFFRFLAEIEAIEKNPLEGFVFKRSKKAYDKFEDHTINFLEIEQIDEIINFARSGKSVHKYRDVAILEMLKTTGCRRDTVLQLKWSDVDFSKGEIKLSHQKTNNRVVVKMAESLKEALLDYFNTQDSKTGHVFISQKGGKLNKDAFSEIIRKYAKNSGMQDQVGFNITSRTFRHSFITHCILNDVHIKKIAHVTGHKDIQTLNYYTHLVARNTEGIAALF